MTSSIGFYSGKFYVLDSGIFLSIVSYLFVNRGLPMEVFNVFLVGGPFFLFVGVWFYARNTLMVRRIEQAHEKALRGRKSSFRRSALGEIFNNLVFGFFLAMIGSLVGMYSSLDLNLTSDVENILAILFSLLVFFILYQVINVIYSKSE